jgi:hypothetical protein
LIARLNAALGHNLGFVNPVLYRLGTGVFRDIRGEQGPPDNSNAGIKGYLARTGWDACTGWGSPNGNALLIGLGVLLGVFKPSITAIITRTDPGGDIPGTHLPVVEDFSIQGTNFVPGGKVSGSFGTTTAMSDGTFSWGGRIRPNPTLPGTPPHVGDVVSATDVIAGITVTAEVQLVEG